MSGVAATQELYLKSLFELEEDGVELRRARLAERMHVALPTVSQTVTRLAKAQLLDLSSADRQLMFTELGRQRAVQVMRKHRVAECFLHSVGVDWTRLHLEACRWEQALSDDSADRIHEMLGFPADTPYGNPVPPAGEGELWLMSARAGAIDALRLVQGHPEPITRRIRSIGEAAQAAPEVLAELLSRGIVPGASATFGEDGRSVWVQTTGADVATDLPAPVAGQIFVAEAEPLPVTC